MQVLLHAPFTFILTRKKYTDDMDSPKEYSEPRLRAYGSVEKMTSAQAEGSQTDKDFPDDTPTEDLTFS
jgi:hypothetical protein